MNPLIIAILVLFASCLATVFLDMAVYDCATKQAEYQEKKMREFDKKNEGKSPEKIAFPETSKMNIPSGPCSRTSQRVRDGASFVFCAIAALLFVYGLLSGKFDIWQQRKNI